jgi:Flp pilus assembly protein TadB
MARRMAAERDTEIREVVSDDPSLSPEANRLLTEEARAAVGADRVRVPRDTPHTERDPAGTHSSIGESFAANRILIAITFFALLVVGAIVSLSTGSWWAVVVAALVHAIGTFVVLTTLASAARQTEHVSPTATARLAEEGVADPDARLSDLVEEYSGIESGENAQPDPPSEAPARAATEQRSANTPAGVPTEPAGTGSGIDRWMPQWIVAALMVMAVVVGLLAPVIGAKFAVVPAIGLPLGVIWLVLRRNVDDESPRSYARWAVLAACTVISVGAFVVLMGWLAGEL